MPTKRADRLMTWHNLRQQQERPAASRNYCLSDFVAPKDAASPDWIGAFAVTAGLGIERSWPSSPRSTTTTSAIMLKALADRLAEACAEWLHRECAATTGAMPPTRVLDNAPR
jgi:5-methyltetrahydrofolate--homocysteine methyltransferase